MATKIMLLQPAAFPLSVQIPLQGGGSDALELTFRHRSRTGIAALQREDADRRQALLDRHFPKAAPADDAQEAGAAPMAVATQSDLAAQREAFARDLVTADAQLLLDMAVAWEFAEPLTLETATAFVDNNVNAMPAIARAYYGALTEARLGN